MNAVLKAERGGGDKFYLYLTAAIDFINETAKHAARTAVHGMHEASWEKEWQRRKNKQ